VAGQPTTRLLESCETATAGRLPLLMLGPIVAAYEQAMTEGVGKNTWWTDRYAPCPRRDASCYLTFLASLGYQLSGIEQALSDDVPWSGDTPAEPDLAVPGAGVPGDDASHDDAQT
jgi:ParB family transcriptional regulator, chromosome partitioning protein